MNCRRIPDSRVARVWQWLEEAKEARKDDTWEESSGVVDCISVCGGAVSRGKGKTRQELCRTVEMQLPREEPEPSHPS